jgi:hypothetical protein
MTPARPALTCQFPLAAHPVYIPSKSSLENGKIEWSWLKCGFTGNYAEMKAHLGTHAKGVR